MKDIFKTVDLDFSAYLMLENVPFLGTEVIKSDIKGKEQVLFCFLDKNQITRDLIRVFVSSREKRYREFLKFLLKEVHRELGNKNLENR